MDSSLANLSDTLFLFLGENPAPILHTYLSKLKHKSAAHLILLTPNGYLINHPQITSLKMEDEEGLKLALWKSVFFKAHFDVEQEGYRPFSEKVRELKQSIDGVASQFVDLNFPAIRNLFQGLSYSLKAKEGLGLKNRFTGTPAIVCGAGPSLLKSLSRLTQWKDKALLFAGGAALSSLIKEGISPHFVASLDAAGSKVRNQAYLDCNAPLFFQLSCTAQLLKESRAALLQIPESEGYLFEKWICKKAGLAEEPFDSGWSVINFQIALAQMVGCTPIILAGVDLCGTRESLYADKKVEFDKSSFIEMRGNAGDLFLTREDWLVSKSWIEKQASKTKFLRLFPSSLDLQGVEKCNFETVEKLPNVQSSLQEQIDRALQELPTLSLSEESLQLLFQGVKRDIALGLNFIKRLLAEIEKSFPNTSLEDAAYVCLAAQFEQSAIYQNFLKPLWSVWIHLFARQKQLQITPLHAEINRLLFFQNCLLKLDSTHTA